MKNVAKCDTWCELQNPVNHRVFERKLRPKPLGRGHVCLGVTHLVVTRTRRVRETDVGLPCPCGAAGLNASPRLGTSRQVVVEILNSFAVLTTPVAGERLKRPKSPEKGLRLRPQVRRDYPLSLSISISGGKETYKDSPSNGERTGKSPA